MSLFTRKLWSERSWKGKLIAAFTAAATLTVGVPFAGKLAYVAGTSETHDCTISKNDPITSKSYEVSGLRELSHFPLGYALGLRGSWVDSQLKIFTPVSGDGRVNKFLLSALCDDGSGQKKATTFEITDSWWRSKNKFRSADIQTELGNKAGEDVRITTTGIRWGRDSWFPNVMSYEQ